jgi:hypothetical protein
MFFTVHFCLRQLDRKLNSFFVKKSKTKTSAKYNFNFPILYIDFYLSFKTKIKACRREKTGVSVTRWLNDKYTYTRGSQHNFSVEFVQVCRQILNYSEVSKNSTILSFLIPRCSAKLISHFKCAANSKRLTNTAFYDVSNSPISKRIWALFVP